MSHLTKNQLIEKYTTLLRDYSKASDLLLHTMKNEKYYHDRYIEIAVKHNEPLSPSYEKAVSRVLKAKTLEASTADLVAMEVNNQLNPVEHPPEQAINHIPT